MELTRIHQIIDWFAGSDLDSFELSEGDARIHLQRPAAICAPPKPAPNTDSAAPSQAAGPVAAEVASPEQGALAITAPIYGICYLSSAPDAPPFVQPGQLVKAGETLCLVEAMKVLNAIPAQRDGTITAILATDGAEVEEGQPLMELT